MHWIEIETWLHHVGREPELLPLYIEEGIEVQEGGQVVVQTVERFKEFRLGERIDFTAHELSEILATTHAQCAELMRSVVALAREKGVVAPPEPAASGEPA